jgi:hypothetical protein
MPIKVLARQRLCAISVCLIFTLSFCPLTRGQSIARNIFDPVPAPLQGRLIKRLKLLIKYQRKQQWGRLYELLSKIYTQGESLEKFKERFERLHAQGLINGLVDFTPKSVVTHDESADHGEWTIFGCVTLIEKERPVRLYGSVTAWRERGDWFFSDVGPLVPLDGNARPCPY